MDRETGQSLNTMVFTHIPSNLCLIIAAFVPSLPVVLAFLLIRAALSQMDVPTRTSYVIAIVTPASDLLRQVYSSPRSLALSVGPALSGALLGTGFSALPLVISGTLRTVYDLALLFAFRHIKPPEEQGSASNNGGNTARPQRSTGNPPKPLHQWWNEAVTMAGIVLAYLSRLGTPMLTHGRSPWKPLRGLCQIKHYEFAG